LPQRVHGLKLFHLHLLMDRSQFFLFIDHVEINRVPIGCRAFVTPFAGVGTPFAAKLVYKVLESP
jgi:hypothetical protein